MTTSFRRPLVLALLAAAALAGTAAQARGHDDVQWSITFGNAVPVAPAHIYVPAPTRVVLPAPVYVHRGWQPTRWDRDGDGIPNRHDRVDNRVHPGWRDNDRDGVPNRYDWVDNRVHPSWRDADRDGVPNRYDRVHNHVHPGWRDSDRDGIPNRWDRHGQRRP